jgi:hypothetical protein
VPGPQQEANQRLRTEVECLQDPVPLGINVHADFKVNAQAPVCLTYIIEVLSHTEQTEKEIY